jgi:hypothetical protein
LAVVRLVHPLSVLGLLYGRWGVPLTRGVGLAISLSPLTHVKSRLRRIFGAVLERGRGRWDQWTVVELVGYQNWNLAPQTALRVAGRMRGLQDSLHCIDIRPRPHVEPDLEPCALSAGRALEHRACSPEVRYDPRPCVLERNLQVSRGPRELGE